MPNAHPGTSISIVSRPLGYYTVPPCPSGLFKVALLGVLLFNGIALGFSAFKRVGAMTREICNHNAYENYLTTDQYHPLTAERFQEKGNHPIYSFLRVEEHDPDGPAPPPLNAHTFPSR